MTISEATSQHAWDSFLFSQSFRPFLQSWTMGEVYRDCQQEPIRLEVRENDMLTGICQSVVVPARRGRHLAVLYGPVLTQKEAITPLLDTLQKIAKDLHCAFIRFSPFWPVDDAKSDALRSITKPSPLHLLGEHVWHIPLTTPSAWSHEARNEKRETRNEETILMSMRQTTRNLIRRAEKEGVTVVASDDPVRDLPLFLKLHDETRKRHHFTPYTDDFFRAQVARFAPRKECTLYIARYQGDVLATSIHMHMGGETSYHHGASTHLYPKIPASSLLQWTAIMDALKRGDHIYSFWGIAPEGVRKHPFAGVTTFKRGFGGELLELMHCADLPTKPSYWFTRSFEMWRKWRRGF